MRPIKKKQVIVKKVQSSEKYIYLCTQYLVGAPFAWTTASLRCGMEAVSLCVMEASYFTGDADFYSIRTSSWFASTTSMHMYIHTEE